MAHIDTEVQEMEEQEHNEHAKQAQQGVEQDAGGS
jgi:hypothetical protein